MTSTLLHNQYIFKCFHQTRKEYNILLTFITHINIIFYNHDPDTAPQFVFEDLEEISQTHSLQVASRHTQCVWTTASRVRHGATPRTRVNGCGGNCGGNCEGNVFLQGRTMCCRRSIRRGFYMYCWSALPSFPCPSCTVLCSNCTASI